MLQIHNDRIHCNNSQNPPNVNDTQILIKFLKTIL